ncbi:hypothetical protein, partial [Bordetella pertussis]|uniref:hypothetical protein n=1 Tax=Bordetella pertussis TaxID=520 RepID=UPI00366AD337
SFAASLDEMMAALERNDDAAYLQLKNVKAGDSSVWRFLQWQHRAGAPGGASHDDLRKRRYRQCSRI